jgi:hypothetical protein
LRERYAEQSGNILKPGTVHEVGEILGDISRPGNVLEVTEIDIPQKRDCFQMGRQSANGTGFTLDDKEPTVSVEKAEESG